MEEKPCPTPHVFSEVDKNLHGIRSCCEGHGGRHLSPDEGLTQKPLSLFEEIERSVVPSLEVTSGNQQFVEKQTEGFVGQKHFSLSPEIDRSRDHSWCEKPLGNRHLVERRVGHFEDQRGRKYLSVLTESDSSSESSFSEETLGNKQFAPE